MEIAHYKKNLDFLKENNKEKRIKLLVLLPNYKIRYK